MALRKFWLQPTAGPAIEIEAVEWEFDEGTLSFERDGRRTLIYGPGQWAWLGELGEDGRVIGVVGKV